MSQEKQLLKNTFIFAIGNIGSKFISFLIVPLYSYYIKPDSLGYYDIVITTVALIQPIIIFQLSDGVYRWLIDSEKAYHKSIIASVMSVVYINVILSMFVYIIMDNIFKFRYPVWIMLYMVTQAIYPIIQQIIRGLGNNTLYAFSGVLFTIIMLVINFVGLVILHSGIDILLISQICATLICCIIFFIKQPILRDSLNLRASLSFRKDILKYSIPLIPNSVSWWIVNSSDRFIVLKYLGQDANGIYSMAYKFPSLLTILANVFYMAWQEAAIREYDSPNRNAFFSKVFKKYYRLLFTTVLFLMPITRIYIEVAMENAYKSSWQYVGFLYLGTIFSALSSFLGLGYQILRETKRSILTTNFAAIINIIVNILLIKKIGLQAASISTFIAYLFLFFIRIRHTKRYFQLQTNWKFFYLLFILDLIVILLLFCCGLYGSILLFIIASIIFIVANIEILLPLWSKIEKIWKVK